MRTSHLAIAPALMLLVAACTGAGPSAPASGGPASPSPGASASPAAQRIEVKLTDALKMEPAEVSVKVGQPVTFAVTNAGAIDHEFYLGDAAAQDAHETEMMSSTAPMSMDETMGFTVKPGETRELTYTFDKAGQMLAGCHVSGHYPAGMKMTIMVTQ